MKPNLLTPWRKQQAGLSLIELMVGLVIGILAMLVILQMYQVFEGQKRTTTTGGDAQANGLFAMTILERDVKMAGYGLSTAASLACANYFTYIDIGAPGGGTAVPGFSTAAISITDGGASSSDSITLRSSTTNLGGAPGSLRGTKPQTSAEFDVTTVLGLSVDDLVLIVQGGNCMLVQLTTIQNVALKVQHNPSGGGGPASPSNPRYNPPGNCFQSGNFCSSWPAFTTGALLLNIGQLETRTYSIDAASSLVLIENGNAAAPIAIATEIVFMKAQYGVSAAAPGSQTIIQWVDAANDTVTGVNWAAPTAADIRRIKAVRIAVVARSTQQENTVVTTQSPLVLWPPDTMTLGKTMPFTTALQQQFRYKVYQTIIPLRNVMWTGI